MLEGQVQKDVLKYLKDHRIYHFRFQAQVNLNGLPDIIALYKGILLGLELKRPKGGKATGLQKRKIETITENGGVGLIIKSVEELDLLIRMIDTYENDLKGEMSTQTLLDMFNYRWENESK